MMTKEDGFMGLGEIRYQTTSDTELFSRFRLDPTDVSVLTFIDNVQPFGVRIPEHEKFALGISDRNGRIVHAHRLGGDFVGTNDSRKPLAQNLFHLHDGRGGDDSIASTLPCNISVLVSQNLFFHLIENSRD